MKKLATIAAVSVSLLFAGTVPVVPEDLKCTGSFKIDVYPTPSGKLEEGFFDPAIPSSNKESATSTKKWVEVSPVRKQARGVCKDDKGNEVVVDITDDEYTSHSIRGSGKLEITRYKALSEIVL